MGITPDELFEMSFKQYVWACEIYKRNRDYDLRKHRSILGAITGKDPRKIIPMPGDYDHIPKQMTREESEEYLRKRGLLDIVDGKKN